ncbi:MAG TPA: hypothetical protein VF487_00480 [Chitinophagaceae bacterium]
MWPFKKKTPVTKINPVKFKSVLCIPGHWTSDQEVKLSIVRSNNGEYIAAGGVLMNAKNQCHFTFEVCKRDDRMRQSFAVAGRVTGVTENFLNEIENHNLVVYISVPSGSLFEAEHIAFAGAAVLKAGGIGIKVETAGKAFEKETWVDLTNNFQESNLYEMFVIDSLYQKDGTTFSCGMQNLGLKDTIVSGLPFQGAVDLIRIFGYYQLVDKPVIFPSQTFTPTPDSPLYRITEETNPPYKGEELLGNPFGMWRLTKE